MKPLNEWPKRDLIGVLAACCPRGGEVVAALLRLVRAEERERCAGECASVAAETYSDRSEIARECEQRIRGLQ